MPISRARRRCSPLSPSDWSDVAADTAASGGDMAMYVGLLFDNFVRNPENARLHDWLNFGASDAWEGSAQVLVLKSKLDDIRAGQEAGRIDSAWDPAQLLIMLIEMTKSMACLKDSVRPLLRGNRQANSRASRRAAAVEAARRLSSPDTGGQFRSFLTSDATSAKPTRLIGLLSHAFKPVATN